MEIQDIVGILNSFNYIKKSFEERCELIESLFRINISGEEVKYSAKKIAEIIQVRLEQDETCPDCNGLGVINGCNSCRNTGKKNIYK